MGRLTTHVLDAAHGCPGSAIKVELYRVEGAQLELVASTLTNSDGRCDAPLLQGDFLGWLLAGLQLSLLLTGLTLISSFFYLL